MLASGQPAMMAQVSATALFVLIGAEPHTGWLPETVQRDRWGFVVTDTDLLGGEGSAAIRTIHQYLGTE